MPLGLLDLVKKGDLDGFETRCLDLLEAGDVPLGVLVDCFKYMEQSPDAERIPALAQMVLENTDLDADPQGVLSVACAALHAAPQTEELRRVTIELYTRVYSQTPGFAAILESSGLTTSGPARAALRVLDFCLQLNVGDTLISRLDDRAVEVVEVDRQRGLFTLRRGTRATTVPAREVVRRYERIDPDDFRVLRQLRPDRLAELIHNDPVALVTGLIHAHGDMINADELKAELVPRHIDARQWSKWWTRARTQLKRSPHIVIEGRAPVVLSYSAEGVTLEDETWTAIAAQNDPVKWLSVAEGYLRELKTRKDKPDPALLRRLHDHIVRYIANVRALRPGEALAGALVLGRLGEQGLPIGAESAALAAQILRQAAEPAKLISALWDDGLWQRALAGLPQARPDNWQDCVIALLPRAPATQLDALVKLARQAGRLDAVQQCVDDALADPIDHAELVYWLWKGPRQAAGLDLPPDAQLFVAILDTLGALGVTLNPAAEVSKHFRARMKAGLALRDYARVRACLQRCNAAAAVPLRRQLERLEGLGDTARTVMLEVLRAAHPQLWVRPEARLAPWEEPDVLWVTPAGLEKRTAQRDELVNVKMPANARRIGEAAALGDLSENAEYRFALEERDLLRSRLAQINRELSLARVLTPHDVPTDHVGIGSRVSLRNAADGSQRGITILGPFETDVERGVYNYQAPVSQRLLGLRPGQRATLTIDGPDQVFEVVSIENGL